MSSASCCPPLSGWKPAPLSPARTLAKTVLLNVRGGQVPPDTGLENKTKPEIVDDVKELGGKALKVAFAPGDSFGTRAGLRPGLEEARLLPLRRLQSRHRRRSPWN